MWGPQWGPLELDEEAPASAAIGLSLRHAVVFVFPLFINKLVFTKGIKMQLGGPISTRTMGSPLR